jgi:hypothetical protein
VPQLDISTPDSFHTSLSHIRCCKIRRSLLPGSGICSLQAYRYSNLAREVEAAAKLQEHSRYVSPGRMHVSSHQLVSRSLHIASGWRLWDIEWDV